ncbi:hypothetical protein [Haliangium sp. UPWRP_2]|uniref:hypothetical protein n=1 Tax=Haliangium sp. UPWRP_2 TaxID=1931276 RepID=UPI0011B213A0|nr:hypothetical protein [Haliangium sp. UPWRP_2]
MGFWDWFWGRRNEPAGRIIVDGDRVRVSSPQSEAPTQAALDVIWEHVSWVSVSTVAEASWQLCEVRQPEDLAELRAAFHIHDGGIGHCMCVGNLQFGFFRGDKPTGIVTLHHSESLRWWPFFDNAKLRDPARMVRWLTAHGITEEALAREATRRKQAARNQELDRWFAGMPATLVPLRTMLQQPRFDRLEAKALLDREHPDLVLQAHLLFKWYGAEPGSWSRSELRPDVPEWFLLQLPMKALVGALRSEPQSECLLEGAARLFSRMRFGEERKTDLAALPADLKQMLRAHSLKSTYPGNRLMAEFAFRA